MPFNNGTWKLGSNNANEGDVFNMGAQPIWSVADNYDARDGDDHVTGNIADNTILGGDGKDTINGWWGNDTIYGGTGADTLKGDLGEDELHGESGMDDIDGGWGNDKIYGGGNSDKLDGDLGNDTIYGGSHNDTIDGGNDDDKLYGQTGNDTIYGGTGKDVLDGGTEADVLNGEDGDDKLFDGSSENVIDIMNGGDGNDFLQSLGGGDIMSGGANSDTFSIGNANSFRTLGGTISGGTGFDTVALRNGGLVDDFSNLSSIERFDLTDNDNQTLRLDFSEVQRLSSTDNIIVFGEQGDRLELDNDVPGAGSGGHWEAATPTGSDDGTPTLQVYNYLDAAGNDTGISVSVDDNVQVVLI